MSQSENTDDKKVGTLPFQLPERARAVPLPGFVSPMLAVPADGKFSHKGWIYEPKLDGMRALTVLRDGKARMFSRRGLEITNQYPKLALQLPLVSPQNIVIDGEIIALDAKGRPSFQQLQQRMNLTKSVDIAKQEQLVPVFYFVFDILEIGGFDLTNAPLRERKRVLSQALVINEMVRIIDYFDEDGDLAYDACIQNGFEGIVAKRLEGSYEIGRRSPSWVKVKAQQTEDFVIGGYTAGQGSRGSTFGALLLGFYDEAQRLIYCGSVGTGFDSRLLDQVISAMLPLRTAKPAFLKRPADKKDAIWLAPSLVAEIKFMDRTRDGHLRAPVFLRLRDELEASQVKRVTVVSPDEAIAAAERPPAAVSPPPGIDAAQFLPLGTSLALSPAQQTVLAQLDQRAANFDLVVGGSSISLTNLDRELWRSDRQSSAVTKRLYLRYLTVVSHLMLTHMQGRPLTLIRLPYGVKGRSFYQKHWQTCPEFIDRAQCRDDQLLFCNNLASLIWFAQNRVLEFHTWTSRRDSAATKYGGATIEDEELANPDFLTIDIDVHSGTVNDTIDREAFKRARDAAFMLRDACEAVSLEPFVKTSGRSGLHIFIPVERKLDFDAIRMLAATICTFAARQKPDHLSIEMQPDKRGSRVLLDSSPNGRNRTVCSVYSARANLQAGVSAPVTWNELANCDPTDFTIGSMVERVLSVGDVWLNILEKRLDLQAMVSGSAQLL